MLAKEIQFLCQSQSNHNLQIKVNINKIKIQWKTKFDSNLFTQQNRNVKN